MFMKKTATVFVLLGVVMASVASGDIFPFYGHW